MMLMLVGFGGLLQKGFSLKQGTTQPGATRSLVSYFRTGLGFGAVLLMLGLPLSASAAPITYSVNGLSSFSITVMKGVTVLGTAVGDLTGWITLDNDAQTVDQLSVTTEPNIQLVLSEPYGGYDNITIDTAHLWSHVGFAELAPPVVIGNGYQTLTGPLAVEGFWSATDSLGVNAPVSGVPIMFPVQSITSIVDPSLFTVTINQVTINSLAGATFGETENLTVLANYQLATSVPPPVPEPGTALLTGFGLVLLTASGRYKRSRS
jgi:hypothetical protein